MSSPTPADAMKFFRIIGQLKTLKRTGWVNNECLLPESVADHMYRMTMLCFLITDPNVNRDRLMKICLVHDLAEAVVGDITPLDGVSKEDKRKLEEDALNQITKDIGHVEIAKELVELWLEYEDGTTSDALVAKQLDKFEMIVQADEYERAQGKRLQSFFTYTQESFTHPEILGWANELRDERNTRIILEDASK